MREYTLTGVTGRDALVNDGVQDYVAFEEGEDAAAWSALLPALGIKAAADGTNYTKRAVFEALVGEVWGVYDEQAKARSFGCTGFSLQCLSRIAGVALELLPKTEKGLPPLQRQPPSLSHRLKFVQYIRYDLKRHAIFL